MREAIGGTWLFQIVIVFVLLFTGFLCLSINHSKAFNVKNSIINAIERNNGIDLSADLSKNSDAALEEIVEYLGEVSYRTTGSCPTGYTSYDRSGKLSSRNAAFCIKKIDAYEGDEFPDMSYYKIIVFYQLDLPIFSQVFNFKVTGDTKVINVSKLTSGSVRT